MVIYVEAVILDNFCLDALLAYLTLLLTKRAVHRFPIILSALVGSLFALTVPIIGDNFLMKIAVLLVCSYLFSFPKSFRIYVVETIVYLLLSFTLCGIISFLLGARMQQGFLAISAGGAVAFTSLSVLLLIYFTRQIIGLINERREREKFAVAEMINQGKSVRMRALYDSGNLLKDQNGDGVVVTDKKGVLRLGELPSFGEMQVHTASGSKVLPLVKIPKIKIYCGEDTNILTNVTAALSDLPEEYQLILPCE